MRLDGCLLATLLLSTPVWSNAADSPGKLAFEQLKTGSHEHAFWIGKDPGGALTRNETYIPNGAKYNAAKHVGDTESFAKAR